MIKPKEIRLENNKLTSLEKFHDRIDVESISVHKTPIKSLNGLPSSNLLHFLDIVGTEIEDMSGIPSQLPSLSVAVLRDNKLKSLQNFPATNQLAAVNVSNNQLESLEGLPDMQPLSQGSVVMNPYVNFCGNPLRTLKGLPKKAFMQSVYDHEHCLDETNIPKSDLELLHQCGSEASQLPKEDLIDIEKSVTCKQAWNRFNRD